ncbi:hypothetical protein SLE2022_275820 [Rubroshorea leprosula]
MQKAKEGISKSRRGPREIWEESSIFMRISEEGKRPQCCVRYCLSGCVKQSTCQKDIQTVGPETDSETQFEFSSVLEVSAF